MTLSALATASAAQAPRLVISTSSDPGGGPGAAAGSGWEDGDLLAVAGSKAPHAYLTGCHWIATGGFAPSDVDGFAFRPGKRPGDMDSLALSILSDVPGYADGDVLGFDQAGEFVVLESEANIVTALGLPLANVDLDAIDYDDQGRLYFSLQGNLAGTVLGDVDDGDVLRLDGNGVVDRILSEADVDACLQAATGTTSSAGDVLGVEVLNGETWVTVQSPSAFDGAVLACGATPRLVADEAAIGLGGAELSALSALPPEADFAVMDAHPRSMGPGTRFDVWFDGPPNSTHLVLMSGNVGWVDFAHAPGFAAWCFDPTDPWLLSFFSAPAPPLVTLDSNGVYRTQYTLPTAPVFAPGWLGRDGWSFQMVDLGTLELSAPMRLLKL